MTKQCLLFCLLLCLFATSAQAQLWSKKETSLLSAEEAFQVITSLDNDVLKVDWAIADDYYMYRDSFAIESNNPQIQVGAINFSQGVIEDDPEFGKVEVYFYNARLSSQLNAQLNTEQTSDKQFELTLRGQGCNKPVGVCYPPMVRTVQIDVAQLAQVTSSTDSRLSENQSKQNITSKETADKSFIAYLLSALGAGILLSFTPCVLPMIPILAGIIAGQKTPSKLRSGWLAICYVAGTIVSYALAGALAGATGAQLQAYFQNVWVIAFICALLVLLAASLFGLFRIELGNSIQNKLSNSGSSNSASISSFLLGLVSALVIGACVSPVIILALGAAITQGDPVLGASIMASMALGMGLLLILFGFGAGWLLPRTGPWMQQIQLVFGFLVLAVAIYLLSTLSMPVILLLWALWLLAFGFYLWHLASSIKQPLLLSVLRALSIAAIIWGVLAIVGGATRGQDILQPLHNISVGKQSKDKALPFVVTTNLNEVQTLMQQAKQNQQPVLVDFYAQWCLDCKRMKRTTFQQDSVHQALKDWLLIEVDVTETSAESEKIKQFFSVFGPPATLLYGKDKQQPIRQYGYLNETEFLSLIKQAN